jgi:D-alanyl-D-alanine carboxypeptidase (penicillin-binding protein 5/6)
VAAGEQLTEYQALQALLLPSANNMAEVLARWAFGSIENYLAFVNPFTKTLGMENTQIADASGYDPATQSTAADLTKLAEIAMNHPVVAEIVGQAQAELPVAGTVYNVNNFLGMDGIIGIKTGNTDEAGGCYMFAVKRAVDDTHSPVLVGVVMGAPDRGRAMDDSLTIINDAFKGFRAGVPIETGKTVGTIFQAGGASVPIAVKQGLPLLVWGNQAPRTEMAVNTLGQSVRQNDEIGSLVVYAGNQRYTAPLVAAGELPQRSFAWRLRHLGGLL